MKLLLLSDDGTVVDSTDDFTRDEFIAAQQSMLAASTLLRQLNGEAS